MKIVGEILLPGDKSISHRSLMFASLCEGVSKISNLSSGQDVETTRTCLEQLGIKSTRIGNTIEIIGGEFKNPDSDLDCGNSGTTTRLMMGLLAGKQIKARFIGDESLSSRPMKRIIDPLSEMGANFISNNGYMPVEISRGVQKAISYVLPMGSAQVKSAVLLAGLSLDSSTEVIDAFQTRDHTEIMLQAIGADLTTDGVTSSVSNQKKNFKSFDIEVPADPSTAAFFASAASLLKGSDLLLKNVLLNPTRIGFFDVLKKMGGNVVIEKEWQVNGEKVGNVRIKYASLKSFELFEKDIPSLIDEIPVLAILATQANGVSKITGAKELRVKECDRIHAICENLKKMGVQIEELEDGMIIQGSQKLRGTNLSTFDDHRIAMSFTIAGLLTRRPIQLDDPSCAKISFPEFYKILNNLIKFV
ncbi:MAG: 3-phosphoshikimate 1-carboxyvinyltransferase [Candidatus Cloacimonadota bacterium]|nr:MAG: 3-phosphoshikimate 1-carboxyvinyltransferase [Candidatus Cloacimonadota bacterium]